LIENFEFNQVLKPWSWAFVWPIGVILSRINAAIQVKHLKNWTFYNWMKRNIFLDQALDSPDVPPWKRAENHLNTDSVRKILVQCFTSCLP